jgi:poly(beta-D-mannuronate) lyase
MIKLKFIFLLLIIVLSVANINARNFLVSSVSQITSRMSTSLPGDTLTMTNGTWNNAQIVMEGNGTSANPILLKVQTAGQVIITGQSNIRIGGNYLIVNGLVFQNGYSPSGAVVEFRKVDQTVSNNCRMTNCSIIDFSNPTSTFDDKWISLYGQNNRFDHNYIKGKTNQGATLVVWLASTPNYHRIDHNFFGYRPIFTSNGAETIRVGTGVWAQYDSYTTVEYNYFERCDGELEMISNKSCHNIYRYNTFYKCQGTLSLRQGNSCTVEGNFFLQGHQANSGGIRIMGEDHVIFNNYVSGVEGNDASSGLAMMDGTVPPDSSYPQIKRVTIAFNTFVDNKYSMSLGVTGSGRTLAPDSCTIANNVVYSTLGTLIPVYNSPTHLTWAGNIFYGSTLGITKPAGITLVDPIMSIGSDTLYRPNILTSPVINAASGSYSYVSLDMDGQPRIGTKDIGSDEISTASIQSKPLTSNDVGPYKNDFVLPVALNLTALIQGLYSNNTLISDTVTVELRNAGSPYALVEAKKGVLNTSGNAIIYFTSAVNGTNYFIVIKHRNSIETWSSSGNSFNSSVLSYDFTSTQNQSYGSNLLLKDSRWCVYSGDVSQDGQVTFTDLSAVDNDNTNFVTGYTATDLTGDGQVTFSDLAIVDNSNTNFIAKVVPN